MVDDFLYVCDDAYTRDQIMRLERKMLSVVGFDLGFSLSYRYRIYRVFFVKKNLLLFQPFSLLGS